MGQLPVLDIDNGKVVITQSGAIARYLGNKHGSVYCQSQAVYCYCLLTFHNIAGLAGKDANEKARVDELMDWNRDIFWQLVIYVIVKNGFPPGEMVNQTYMADYAIPCATNKAKFRLNLLLCICHNHVFLGANLQ
jgi:glutathione S-transferase